MAWGVPLFKRTLGETGGGGLAFHMVNVPSPLLHPLVATCVLCNAKANESLLCRNVNVLIKPFLTSLIHLISLINCRALQTLIRKDLL